MLKNFTDINFERAKNAEISVGESFSYLTVINLDNCLFSNYSYTCKYYKKVLTGISYVFG